MKLTPMILRALIDETPKIFVCKNPHTRRWITTQYGEAIADSIHVKDALAVARALAQSQPKPRDKSTNANVVVEAVGCIGESPIGLARLGDGRG